MVSATEARQLAAERERSRKIDKALKELGQRLKRLESFVEDLDEAVESLERRA
ncbi:hypothetical protein I6F07_31960 [Ensifer sp. IC4062]|nr:hypothetical protein [Ensifer sp. IC4062]MCA1444703.1 hypothetical protein [Ensifer sp. IC4062]